MSETKPKLRIADLLPIAGRVEVSTGNFLPIRPLYLDEMINLFLGYRSTFLSMYATSIDADAGIGFAPFLTVAPELVAKIIALASDTEGQEDDIKLMPATVQLIALHDIWKLSVPDPKKAAELLSEVTGQLLKLKEKQKSETLKSDSPQTLSVV